jgi:hypothetical protein
VRDLLATSKVVSETLQQSMAANAVAVQRNLEATDARIKALAAKLERLGAP